jgi:hypothetical protein
VNRSQLFVLLTLASLPACSAEDDQAPRPPVDAGRDRMGPRADGQGDKLDASGGSYADEASTGPEPDAVGTDQSSPPDSSNPPGDVVVPPPDRSGPADGSGPPSSDAAPPPFDIASDSTLASCAVTFTVSGVSWMAPEGGAADAQARAVRLVGDAANIGFWAPAAGVLLTEVLSGTWSGSAVFRDGQLTEFKFVKFSGAAPEWESWLPYDSNRSLRVECFGDGGIVRDAGDALHDGPGLRDEAGDAFGGDAALPRDVAGDATTEGGTIDATADGTSIDAADLPEGGSAEGGQVVPVPARGRSYAGVFGVRPADATK